MLDQLSAPVLQIAGSGLVVAGVTDTCGTATGLATRPNNRSARCDDRSMARALGAGAGSRTQ